MEDKVLVTGGAGFIGSHLVKHLLELGKRVVVVDDLSTGRRENLASVVGSKCELVVSRASEAAGDKGFMKQFGVVYHLAAAVGVKLIVDEPIRTIETNVEETGAVLKAAAEVGSRVLLASSSEVYGKSERVPFREEDDVAYGSTAYSRWSYALTKAIDEYLGMAYFRERGLGAVVTRFFNTVGPGQVGQYGMVVPRFIERAVADRPIEIYGDGQQSRCFCHVRDVVGALPRLLDEPKCWGRVFNVGSEEEVSIEGLADRIIALSGSQSEKIHVPYEQAYNQGFDDLRRRVPDLSRVREAIGFNPRYNLDSILKELIELEVGRQRGAC